jgi:hypothetical protein
MNIWLYNLKEILFKNQLCRCCVVNYRSKLYNKKIKNNYRYIISQELCRSCFNKSINHILQCIGCNNQIGWWYPTDSCVYCDDCYDHYAY